MKSHDQKMAEKAAHEAELERNDLYAWLQKVWTQCKSGQIWRSRSFITALLVIAAVGLAYYLLRGRSAAENSAWRTLDNTWSLTGLEEYAKNHPSSLPGKVARLQAARQQLGPLGLSQLSNINPDTRGKAIAAIEAAREEFLKLADEFKDDLTLTAQAIDGAAHAELALVGIPKAGVTDPASTEYRGSVDKAIELFRRYAKVAGDGAGASAKKLADELEAKKQDVLQLGKLINTKLMPERREEPKLPTGLTPTPSGPSQPPPVAPTLPPTDKK